MPNKMLAKGYVQVYTGNNKGKTTAALGLAFRAWGRGLKTYIGQFMKGQDYAELTAAAKTDGHIIIERYGKNTFIHVKNPPDPDDIELASAGFEKLKAALIGGEYDIIVADEINTAHYFHLLTVEDMRELIRLKPDGVELVFTGRYCPPEIIDAADLVTEMVEIKHYWQSGVDARDGIER
ncbi:MAG: cob(I)yrinic acid a,c-diamide adenosyltransferase [Candidatus Lernaella stagnicola]|nr:cob(I)yrinic acid a,c-diamide adenosyltransferase [Candidatus Lernaella stagnicola]